MTEATRPGRLGVAEFVWTFGSIASRPELVDTVGELGFDVLEILVPADLPSGLAAVRDRFQAAGVAPLILAPAADAEDPSSADEAIRRAGVRRLISRIEAAAELGADLVSGPVYAPPGRTRVLPAPARRAELERAARSLAEAAVVAERHGVRIALEPLNRFETDLVTTVADGLRLCEMVGHGAVGLLLDTFHMSIEEDDLAEALRSAGDRLLHIHACENHRGPLGTGHVPWQAVLGALTETGFTGPVSLESFGPGAEGVRAAARWRPWFDDPDAFAREGLDFLRRHLASPTARPTIGATRG